MNRPIVGESLRAEKLIEAQDMAAKLFAEINDRRLVRAGVGERALSDEIHDLAATMFGVTRHWHKRIVRSGINTLETFRGNPPDRQLSEDDVVFLDFGPIFEEWEADFGRTYVLGDDPRKLELLDRLPEVWLAGREFFRSEPEVTGEQLYDFVVTTSREVGWDFGGIIAGHLVGEFPHDKIDGEDIESYVAPGSTRPMRRKDRAGNDCHWILEVHLIDRDRGFGGFYEELLDLP
ncbi:aminopeptidase [Mycobacterium sp. 852013-50091_SCH5140682]|uniref:M24 family metallopeptidase n=1 Tax=Mycobacterium sp. 852013-50091_SCH5140682 TaxID=1834109 RepID=UPI0007EBB161|nr:M24 family metallopeptidase [Mycobacterium sp. 852013-50091_SCH5140682]OBC17454.1 aminopeptidase [Mycobacterium sp. 852013-50091_SCH5140682]